MANVRDGRGVTVVTGRHGGRLFDAASELGPATGLVNNAGVSGKQRTRSRN